MQWFPASWRKKKEKEKKQPNEDKEQQQVIPLTPGFAATTKAIIKIAAPFAAARLFQVVGDFTGAMMLSKVNQETLAASALISTTQKAVISTSLASLYSTGILIGRQHGVQDTSSVSGTIRGSIVQGILFAVPSTLLLCFSAPILTAMGQEKNIANIVQSYFRGYAYGIPATYWLGTMQQFSLGISKSLLASSLIAINTTLTLSFGYIFVFGKFGSPKMGAQGLGLASSTSAWITFLGGLLYFRARRQFSSYGLFKIAGRGTFSQLKQLLRLGIPIGLQVGSECIALTFDTVMVGWLGQDDLTASQVTLQYLSFFVLPVFGLSQASGVLVGQAASAKNFAYTHRIGGVSNLLGVGISTVALVTFSVMPKLLLSPFIDINDPNNAQIISTAQILFIINGVGQLADTTRNVNAGLLRGFKDMSFSMFMGITSMIAIGLPLAYLFGFPLDLGAMGIFAGRSLGIYVGASVMLGRWLLKSRKQSTVTIEEIEEDTPNTENSLPQQNSEGILSRCWSTLFGRKKTNIKSSEASEKTRLLDDPLTTSDLGNQ